MDAQPKESGISAFHRKHQRELRRTGKTGGHSVARGSSEKTNMEATQTGEESEQVHPGDRASFEKGSETDEANDPNTDSDNPGTDD